MSIFSFISSLLVPSYKAFDRGYKWAKHAHISGVSIDDISKDIENGMAFDPTDFDYGAREYCFECAHGFRNDDKYQLKGKGNERSKSCTLLGPKV